MRSPLNVVHNGISFAIQDLGDSEDNEDIMQNLDDIREAARAAVSVLDEFLNFEKIESGLFQVNPVDTSLYYILSSMVKPLNIFARHKNIQFHVSPQLEKSKLATSGLCIDRNKMSQVFRNLVVNAVKFTPEEGRITVTFREETSTTTTITHGQSNGTSTGAISTRKKKKNTLTYLVGTISRMLNYLTKPRIQDMPDHQRLHQYNVDSSSSSSHRYWSRNSRTCTSSDLWGVLPVRS